MNRAINLGGHKVLYIQHQGTPWFKDKKKNCQALYVKKPTQKRTYITEDKYQPYKLRFGFYGHTLEKIGFTTTWWWRKNIKNNYTYFHEFRIKKAKRINIETRKKFYTANHNKVESPILPEMKKYKTKPNIVKHNNFLYIVI